MLKKLTIGIMLCIASQSAFAISNNERETFAKAVDNAVYSYINARHNILVLVSGYAYEYVNIEDLSLEQIRVYTAYYPAVTQCIFKNSDSKYYQKSLSQSLNTYYNQVSDKQFAKDLAYITDEKRQAGYAIQKQVMQIFLKMPDISPDEQVSPDDIAKVERVNEELEVFAEQHSDMDLNAWSRDVDHLMSRAEMDDEAEPLLNLLGLSLVNMPFDTETGLPPSPMSVYAQKVIDDCHKPLWQKLYDEAQAK